MFGVFLYAVECHCPLLQSPLPGGCCCFPGSMGRAGACGPPSSPSGFGPSGRWGAGSPWARPPCILVCVYMPGSLQFTAPSPVCREAPAAIWGLSPFWGSLWSPPAPRWASEGLSSPERGHRAKGVTGGLFLLVASLRAILQVGLCACCSFLTLIPAMGGFGMGSRCGDTVAPGCGRADGAWGCPIPGGESHCAKSPPPQLRLTLIGGCGDTGSVPMWLWGSAWYLTLSFWGSGALSDRPPRALLRYVCGWGGGGRARQRCPGLRCCLPGPGL